ncbi:MAG: YncE family protein [Gemmatimonadaceae bacterium]|nr:YncE family protein [Gemmatimonadaceae bacterium]
MSSSVRRVSTLGVIAGTAMLIGLTPLAAKAQSGLSGTLIITNKTPATATIIDVVSGRTLATLPTGHGPHEIVVSRDGKTAVVTDYGTGPQPGNTLTVIDVPGRRVTKTISLGQYRRPHGIMLMPGDSIAAVTVEADKAVLLVRLATGEIAKTVMTNQNGSHMVGITADGTRGWTGDIGSNTVSELDLVRGTSIRTVAVPAQPEAINVTPDGKEVWVGSNATGRVSVVDAATGQVTTAAEGFGWPYRVLFSPDNRTVLLPDLRGETLRFLERSTRKELGRIDLKGKAPQGIIFEPSGRYAFLSFSGAGVVAVIDVAARRVVREIPAGETPDGVAYTTLK